MTDTRECGFLGCGDPRCEPVCAGIPRPSVRRFTLQRDVDVSGVSGTGTVAEGVQFTDGVVVIRWVTGDHRSTVVWDDLHAVEVIHGHGGATRIVWAD